ncbi:MAG TPA: MFS transporter [Candidatus Thioglobus sp.]|jgi:MFS family permease|nr:MFS transporter [Candidatus Thioglobus sp.]HIL42980.1 MFS transporter [Gammaproteobacteria bacterium]
MNRLERTFALKISSIMAARMFGLFMIFPVFSVYANEYTNTTPYLIGLAIGIYGLTQALLQIPFGYLSDQFGRKPILVIGLVLFFIGSVVAAESTDIMGIVAGRALQGSGAISAVLMAYLADYVSPEQRAKANAFVGAQIGAAFMLSILLGPIITVNFGISGLFWSISALSIVALLIVVFMPHTRPKTQYKMSLHNFKKILNYDLLRLDLSAFSLHLVLTCAFIVMPVLLVDNNIIEIKDNWKMYLPVILLSFAGMIPMIILAEKYKKTKAVLLTAIGALIISQILFYKTTLNYTTFFAIMTIFFVAFNSLEALLPSLLSRTASTDKRGLAMGMFSTSQFLGAFMGGVFGGWIYNKFGINSVFLFTTLIATIWWISMFTMKQNN